jgi:hypothetical protein
LTLSGLRPTLGPHDTAEDAMDRDRPAVKAELFRSLHRSRPEAQQLFAGR